MSTCTCRKANWLFEYTLAYAKLLDNGFWIDRAYHGYQPSNLSAYRQIGLRLVNDSRANAVRNIVWIFRDDLMNLYELSMLVGVNDVRVSGEEQVGLDVLHALSNRSDYRLSSVNLQGSTFF